MSEIILHIILTFSNVVWTKSLGFNTKRFGVRMFESLIRSETEYKSIQGFGLGFGFDVTSEGFGQVYYFCSVLSSLYNSAIIGQMHVY